MGFNLKFKIEKNTLPINPTYFINSLFDNFEYLIGTYDGKVYKSSFNKPNSESGSHQDYLFLEKNGDLCYTNKKHFLCIIYFSF